VVSSSPALIGKAGVCSIDVQHSTFIWRQPWQRTDQSSCSGTGFVIDGHRILTNAHVVEYAVDVRVRLLGSPKKYKAQVQVYAPDVDLAVLKLDDINEETHFFYTYTDDEGGTGEKRRKTSIALELAQELPDLQDR
jgi:S1-C subfamily serine protease